MTIQEALDRVDMMRPNSMKKEFKLAALSELDGLIIREIVKAHYQKEGEPDPNEFEGYTEMSDPGTVLIAPFPYDEIYTYWLCCKVDFENLEIDKFNNDKELYNNAFDSLSDYWTRTHMPKQRHREIHI